jgi:hypothetical protein
MGKINMNGGESCWADSTITNMITLDENNIKMFDLSPNSNIFGNLMKNKRLGDNTDSELIQMIDKLLSIVKCNSFQNVKKIVLASNNLNDNHFNLIKDKFIELLKKSNIEILDIRNNNLTENTVQDFNNLNITNTNDNVIDVVFDDMNTNEINTMNNENDTWKDSVNQDNINLFIPESMLNSLYKLLSERNNRINSLNRLITRAKEIRINNNLKKEEVTNNANIETIPKPAEQTKLLGIGWLGLGGNLNQNSGIEISIPRNTVTNFLNMSQDKTNLVENVDAFISSLNDIKVENKLIESDRTNYFRNIKQLYAKGGKQTNVNNKKSQKRKTFKQKKFTNKFTKKHIK